MLNISLYIHIPYCKSKCNYCNFYSVAGSKIKWQQYLSSLEKEIAGYKNLLKERCVQTIYIGGGTPSFLPDEFYKKLIVMLKNYCKFSKELEFTIEVNPNSLTETKCKTYKKLGINRISIGAQSCNDKLLGLINRSHNSNDFFKAVNIIKKHFNNFSVDLMIGLPSQTLKDVKESIKQVVKFKPTHISCYGLILEEDTPLFKNENLLKEIPNEDTQVKMYDFAVKTLKKAGFERYEVSNFALKNRQDSYISKHNYAYWLGGDYLGLGTAAHSFVNGKRWENTADIKKYFGGDYKSREIALTKEQKTEEQIMLGLRTKWGIDKNLCNQAQLPFLLKNGFVKVKNNKIIATNKGFKVLNQIILKLI